MGGSLYQIKASGNSLQLGGSTTTIGGSTWTVNIKWQIAPKGGWSSIITNPGNIGEHLNPGNWNYGIGVQGGVVFGTPGVPAAPIGKFPPGPGTILIGEKPSPVKGNKGIFTNPNFWLPPGGLFGNQQAPDNPR